MLPGLLSELALHGIGVEELPGGSLKLTQGGLIDRILTATNIHDCNPNVLPCSRTVLGSDPDGPSMNEESWSELPFEHKNGSKLLHQAPLQHHIGGLSRVCRINSNPKQPHASAIKTIIRSLKETKDQGTQLESSPGHFLVAAQRTS